MSRDHAAIYARFSDAKQNALSIAQQVRKCREYAADHDLQILPEHVYSDEAISGARDDRAGLQALLGVATNPGCPFSTILVDDTSRLSRELVGGYEIMQRLRFNGIRLVCISQGIDSDSEQSDVLFGVHGIVDSVYLKELGKKVYRGVEDKILNGMHGGGRVFGYRNVVIEHPTKTDPRGKPATVGVRLEVEELEAATVRRIFELYASGHSLKAVAKLLNSEGVTSPRPQAGRVSQSWCPTAIRTILRNDRYRGIVIWGKTKKIRAPNGKRVQRKVPSEEWKRVDAPEQRIVTEELWGRVQERISQVKERFGNPGGRSGLFPGRSSSSPYLFSGLVKCGECGANMNIVTGRGQRVDAAYGCPLHVYRGVCGNSLRIRRDVLEKRLLERLQSEVLRKEVIEYTLARFESELEKALRSLGGELEQMRRRKVQLEGEVKNLTRAIADGHYSAAIMAEITEKEGELRGITDKLLEARPDSIRGRVEEIRTFALGRLKDLRGLLNSDPVTAKAELSKHIAEIRLMPDGNIYIASGTWDLQGVGREVVRSVGAGGRN